MQMKFNLQMKRATFQVGTLLRARNAASLNANFHKERFIHSFQGHYGGGTQISFIYYYFFIILFYYFLI